LHVGDGSIASTQSPRVYFSSENGADSVACEIRQGRFNKDVLVVSCNQSLSANLFNAIENGTSRFVITGAGRVGIGSNNPQGKLVVSNSGAEGCEISPGSGFVENLYYNRATSSYVTAQNFAALHRWGIGGNEAMRLDASSRLLVGTSSSRTDYKLQVEGTASSNGWGSFVHNSNDSTGAIFKLLKSRGTAVGSNTVVQSGDSLGRIDFDGADGSTNQTAATIRCDVDGTPGAGDMPGRLVFSTTADGASSPTERMRISEAGHILGGGMTSLTAGSSVKGFNFENQGNNGRLNLHANSSAGTASGINFYHSGSQVGGITYSSTATAYNTSSDYRLKENVVPLTGAADRLNQLQVHRFNFIADPDKIVDGFLAHEAQAVVPECVTGTKDEVDADGNPVYQGIDQSKLVPLLTAALQEAIAKIETLEAKVAALEAA
jgi:hypothetical protein